MKAYLSIIILATSLLHTTNLQTFTFESFKSTCTAKLAIAKQRFIIAKRVLRIPVGVACSMAPVLVFAHYAPAIAAGMGGGVGALVVVGAGAFYTGKMSIGISTIFNKPKS